MLGTTANVLRYANCVLVLVFVVQITSVLITGEDITNSPVSLERIIGPIFIAEYLIRTIDKRCFKKEIVE